MKRTEKVFVERNVAGFGACGMWTAVHLIKDEARKVMWEHTVGAPRARVGSGVALFRAIRVE